MYFLHLLIKSILNLSWRDLASYMTMTDLNVTHNGMYPPSQQFFFLLTHHIFCLLEMFIPPSKFLTFCCWDICIVSAVHNGRNHTLYEKGRRKKKSVIQSSTSQSTNYFKCWNHYIFRVWEPHCIFNPIVQSLLKNSLIEHKNKPRYIVNRSRKSRCTMGRTKLLIKKHEVTGWALDGRYWSWKCMLFVLFLLLNLIHPSCTHTSLQVSKPYTDSKNANNAPSYPCPLPLCTYHREDPRKS